MNALTTDDIIPTIVKGFDRLLKKGSSNATKPPKIIEIRYLGYLATLEKNSPISPTNRLLS
tara:strand:- start:3829 stop:4011 length:183 start_codon:yes stop_codon:yes gene_type:complete